MTDKAIKFECKKDCKKKNTSECYELNCIEGQINVLEQLSRKTAECEKLKEENEELNKRNTFLLQRLEVDDNDTSLVFKLQNELRQKENEFYQAIKSNVKYKQVLNEIANIIKNRIEEKYHKNCKHFKNCTNACGIGIQEELNTILDIISKAKDGKNE